MLENDTLSRDKSLVLFGVAAFVFSTFMWVMTWQVFFAIPLLVGLACMIAGLIPLNPSARRLSIRIGLASFFIAFVVAFGLIQYANRLEGSPVKIIVPDGSKGKFWIVIDKVKGQTPSLVNGIWVFEIPPSGTLLINDDGPLRVGHEEDYYFRSGQRFNPTSDDIGSTNGQEGYWFIVP